MTFLKRHTSSERGYVDNGHSQEFAVIGNTIEKFAFFQVQFIACATALHCQARSELLFKTVSKQNSSLATIKRNRQ